MSDTTTAKPSQSPPPGQRGPAEHERRDQILAAAEEHFRRFGFNKTTVADLAGAIGFSPAHIYRFFESKHEIGEAICGQRLGKIHSALRAVADERKSAADRLRRLYKTLAQQGAELFFNERKLHDICRVAVEEKWRATKSHEAAVQDVIRRVLSDGREAGEFERKTPIDETCRAIFLTMLPFWHPIILEERLEQLDESTTLAANLVLRSLAP